jgi:hypothetical protein
VALSGQFFSDRSKASGEDVVSDLCNHGIPIRPYHFKISPPLCECAVTFCDPM